MPQDYRQRLHEARLEAGLTQRELAQRIDCAHTTVSVVESLQRHLGAPKLFAWAEVCGVSLDYVAHGAPTGADSPRVLEVTA